MRTNGKCLFRAKGFGFGKKEKKKPEKKPEKKRAKNRLFVEESPNDDNSVVLITPAKLEELEIFQGDTVLIKGKRSKEHVCVAMPAEDDSLEDFKIQMNRNIRKNLKVKLGDIVTVKQLDELPNATRVHILPIEDTVEGIEGKCCPALFPAVPLKVAEFKIACVFDRGLEGSIPSGLLSGHLPSCEEG